MTYSLLCDHIFISLPLTTCRMRTFLSLSSTPTLAGPFFICSRPPTLRLRPAPLCLHKHVHGTQVRPGTGVPLYDLGRRVRHSNLCGQAEKLPGRNTQSTRGPRTHGIPDTIQRFTQPSISAYSSSVLEQLPRLLVHTRSLSGRLRFSRVFSVDRSFSTWPLMSTPLALGSLPTVAHGQEISV